MNNNWNYNDNRRHMRGRHRGGRGPGGNRGNRDFWPRRGGGGFDGPRNRPEYGRRDFDNWKPQPRRNTPTKRLSEDAIGVTEYINNHEGFNGIIKSRFSDFQVSEINEQGQVAKLTDPTPPPVPKENEVVDDEYLLLNKYNPEILPMETWDKINTVAVSTGSNVEKVQIDVTGMTKEQRTKIHDAVKKAFGDSIVGSTVTVQDKKYVTFDKYRKGVRVDNRVKWVWPGEYVYFVVYKENCDTMDAASRIAERLRMQMRPSLLGYAGTKDRRAKTSQWFSLRKFDPRKVAAACRDLRDVRLGNYTFHPQNLRLGMLQGNLFRICLRNVTATDECVKEACSLLKEQGFINYYGLQRFGTRIEVPTYEIGVKLLQGNFREAISSILSERDGPLWGALRAFARDGPRAAVRLLPRDAPSSEARLIRSLANDPNDLVGAMDSIARNARLMYVHSYQSLVWNRVASERLRRHARVPVPGDLVPLQALPLGPDDVEEESDEEENQNNDSEQNTEKSDKIDKKTDKPDTDKKESKGKEKESKPKTIIPVKVLTQEDCDSGQYSISDVVLPLPGFSIEYPPNMVDYYKKLLTQDGLKLDMKHRYKNYSMCGGYRHLVVRPSSMTWECVRYSDPFADLLLSDLDELEGTTTTGAQEDGKFKALLLTLTLPASCYATMALRELLKADTSSDNQALQNNYHKVKKVHVEDKKDQTDDDKEQADGEQAPEGMDEDSAKTAEKRKGDDIEEVEVKKAKLNDDLL